MTDEKLMGYVEKADSNAIRVRVIDRQVGAALNAIGFLATVEPGVYTLSVSDNAEKARAFDALRSLNIAFSDGKEWCPAQVFEYLRDLQLLSGTFVRISWTEPGKYRLVEI